MLFVAPLVLLTSSALAQTTQRTYPPMDQSGPAPLPEWVRTYEAAKRSGSIPDIAPSKLDANGVPSYAANVDQGINGICSHTTQFCLHPTDVVHANDGQMGVAFDDGPHQGSDLLLQFFSRHRDVLTGTHFLIGGRIAADIPGFQRIVRGGGHLASHTWSHTPITLLDDMGVLGELGWTNQIIYDLTGHVPRFWRPPTGDVDNRIRAIAWEVFGLETVIWNHDTYDWCLNPGASAGCASWGITTPQQLDRNLAEWLRGPKSPGLMILHHESSNATANGFIRNFPLMQSQGWNTTTVADSIRQPWYLPIGTGVGQGPAGQRFNNGNAVNTTSRTSGRVQLATSTGGNIVGNSTNGVPAPTTPISTGPEDSTATPTGQTNNGPASTKSMSLTLFAAGVISFLFW